MPGVKQYPLWLHCNDCREILLRARAIECQAYVVAAAQAGKHNEKRESYGHALIVDPWGEVVARLEDPLATGEWLQSKHCQGYTKISATIAAEGMEKIL
jgi:predicted amidohydrolase